jgi:hypothetical protein
MRSPPLLVPQSGTHTPPALPTDSEFKKLAREGSGPNQAPSWTQTGESSGMMPLSQIQSIAGTLTRTQPWEAG